MGEQDQGLAQGVTDAPEAPDGGQSAEGTGTDAEAALAEALNQRNYDRSDEGSRQETGAEDDLEAPRIPRSRLNEVASERDQARQEAEQLRRQMAELQPRNQSPQGQQQSPQQSGAMAAPWERQDFVDRMYEDPAGTMREMGHWSYQMAAQVANDATMRAVQQIGQYLEFTGDNPGFKADFKSGAVTKAMQKYGTDNPYLAYRLMNAEGMGEKVKAAEEKGRSRAVEDQRLKREAGTGVKGGGKGVSGKPNFAGMSDGEFNHAVAALAAKKFG